jgi:hypothetical protein
MYIGKLQQIRSMVFWPLFFEMAFGVGEGKYIDHFNIDDDTKGRTA